jgi:hypothetical protein
MASISKVLLQIFERAGSAQVQVSYTLTATHHDGPHEQAYRELVQLIGVDIGPGEDGVSEVLPGGTIWDGVVDPGPVIREDEIRARVTLTPLPPVAPSRESNTVRRGGPVIQP